MGVGSTARYELRAPDGGVRAHVYRLFVLVHAVRVAVEAQASLLDRVEQQAGVAFEPFEVDVATPDAKGSLLERLAEGVGRPPARLRAVFLS